jgi:2-polyprenyl-6-methoxyphenol hydroxylase-like FAD-dependent oxidoreductase
MAPLKILISGGGIAGNALAFWLSKLGHNVTVIEWYPSLRATGLQLDLRGHGIEVMKRMGLEEAFRSKKAPEQGVQLVDKTGKRRAYFPANKSGKGLQDFTTDWEIMRGDLCQIIHDATKDRTSYIFGTSVESLEEKNDAIEVRFADGKAESYDLLVGADGQGSRIRKMLLGSDAVDKVIPLGGYVGYLRIPRAVQEGEEEYIATWYLATNSRFIMTRRHSEHEMQAYLICTADAKQINEAYRQGADKEKKAFAEFFHGAGWRTEELLEALKGSDDFYCERVAFVKMDSWSRGRVALVGDAAYCPSVMTGMGTTSALVGAYILAGEIGTHCERGSSGEEERGGKDGIDAALKAYEERYRPFMRQVQKGLSEDGWAYWPTSPFGIAVINRVAGLVASLRLNVIGGWFLKEKVQGWELPDYEEMLEI